MVCNGQYVKPTAESPIDWAACEQRLWALATPWCTLPLASASLGLLPHCWCIPMEAGRPALIKQTRNNMCSAPLVADLFFRPTVATVPVRCTALCTSLRTLPGHEQTLLHITHSVPRCVQ